ncbi:Rrf2 family transcriptional regulator [Sinorhizobium meliloti]|jgi:Rrf2 family protein|uniref:BadM/Rrf2 family transcriptional regulator n=2 Tax=Sinorhizobium TaxID=28105 RepID=H0FXH0_RHIML|nr:MULTISPECIES: Rrf2 family transcriptional regulator [Sinorhizobium]ASP86516.1 Rrf2 family transcriptional regulator [Sinorhizobium meliloti]ASP93062.1 Rrf2 family transcriptional regulator [Sinorhizobium meliloti]EHK78305.1 BadM/Rrf2 family transcriptional regulator [Sinorhizobium meliloti CCNWSX0020]MDW9374663.1 transcriptional regulator [Sinorhizobium meliloti]MDW9415810.1 transcriptional regulator [Sinorhizobium meliloti]
MKRDSRLSITLHALLHMAERETITSEELAACLSTNPVVVRRTMAGLREAGLVRSERGHGGGWSLVRDLATISLADVHAALGEPAVFAIGNRTEAPGCVVEQAVNAAMDGALRDAEALLMQRLERISLADLSNDFQRRMTTRRQQMKEQNHGG